MNEGDNFNRNKNWYLFAVVSIVVFILLFAVFMFFLGQGALHYHYQWEKWSKMMGQ